MYEKKGCLHFILKAIFSKVIIFLTEISFENRRLGIINRLILFQDVLIVQQYLYRPVTTKIWSIWWIRASQTFWRFNNWLDQRWICQSLIYTLSLCLIKKIRSNKFDNVKAFSVQWEWIKESYCHGYIFSKEVYKH